MNQNSNIPAPQAATEPVNERAMIEAAAAAAPVANSTTTQKAMNIMEASVIQRRAVAEAFEAQKTAITEAVTEQRVAAMQQMATAKKKYAAMEAKKKMADADQATKNLGYMAREAMGEKKPSASAVPRQDKEQIKPTVQIPPAAVPQAAAEPQQAVTQQAATNAPAGQVQSQTPQTPAPMPAPQPAPQQPMPSPQERGAAALGPATIAGTPVADELAQTIRNIITVEVDAQLKALLAVHTGKAPTEPQQ